MRDGRIKLISVFFYISFLILTAALFYFQIIKYEYYSSLSLKNTVRTIPLEASRGGIFDRRGNALAKDEISFALALIPQEISDLDKTLDDLCRVTGRHKDSLEKAYRKSYRLPFVPADIISDIPPEKAFAIEEKIADIPGAIIWSSPRRVYPNGKTGSHITGYVGKINEPEFNRLKDYGYTKRDIVGKSGLEKYYDAYLKGSSGGIQIEVDSRSREVSRIGFKEPKGGRDIVTTIDLGLQKLSDMLFENKKGACIVMSSKTGEILALSASPGFDPNVFVTGSDTDRIRVLSDKEKPLINRAITGVYPAGSTFKPIVAYAGLAAGLIEEHTSFMCTGSFKLGKAVFRCWKESGHGYQNVAQALSHSCNVFFYNTGKALGGEQICKIATSFGLGSLTGIDLPNESKGVVPGPSWKRSAIKAPWYDGDTINFSIGQGFLEVTPVQMLRVITIIANRGFCPKPYLVEEIEGVKVSNKKEYAMSIKPEAFEVIRQGLHDAVNSKTGTGQNAKVKGVEISGKTGTAQSGPSRKSHAWFIGYAPSDNPEVSFVVFIEHGGKGGQTAAAIVRLIGVYLKENGYAG